MTTALIGKEGATAVRARVAVVSRGGATGLANQILRSGHEPQEFTGWDALVVAHNASPLDLVLFDDDAAEGLPEDLPVPAVHVAERVGATTRSGFGSIPAAALEQALDSLLALAIELRHAAGRSRDLEQFVGGVRSGSALVGRSPVMRRLHGVISRAADCDATVLIEGPAGSGKSLASRVVHCKSRRSVKPMRVADCGSLDSEAMTTLLDETRGTTLVLEDIDRLSSGAQAILVRHLKDRSVPRSDQAPRLIATTAAHLPELVAKGAFREDLFYRLNAFPMVMPSLRERTDDIAAIAEAILAAGAAQQGRPHAGFTPSALVLLESMPWPGNVAQLEMVVQRAQALAGGAAIDREHLVSLPAAGTNAGLTHTPHRPSDEEGGGADIGEEAIRPFEEEEQMLLTRALRATKGNVRRAAQLLAIGRATLYRKIQQYKLRLQ